MMTRYLYMLALLSCAIIVSAQPPTNQASHNDLPPTGFRLVNALNQSFFTDVPFENYQFRCTYYQPLKWVRGADNFWTIELNGDPYSGDDADALIPRMYGVQMSGPHWYIDANSSAGGEGAELTYNSTGHEPRSHYIRVKRWGAGPTWDAITFGGHSWSEDVVGRLFSSYVTEITASTGSDTSSPSHPVLLGGRALAVAGESAIIFQTRVGGRHYADMARGSWVTYLRFDFGPLTAEAQIELDLEELIDAVKDFNTDFNAWVTAWNTWKNANLYYAERLDAAMITGIGDYHSVLKYLHDASKIWDNSDQPINVPAQPNTGNWNANPPGSPNSGSRMSEQFGSGPNLSAIPVIDGITSHTDSQVAPVWTFSVPGWSGETEHVVSVNMAVWAPYRSTVRAILIAFTLIWAMGMVASEFRRQ